MRQGRKPTRKQKDKNRRMSLDPYTWLVSQDNENCFVIVHRVSGAVRRLWRAKHFETKKTSALTEVEKKIVQSDYTTGAQKLEPEEM